MLKRGDSVLLQAHSQFRSLFIGLARRLRQETGVAVHLYVVTRQQKAHYERVAPDAFDSITVSRTLYDDVEAPVDNPIALFEKGQSYEDRLDISLNSIVLTDRHLGRGFALGGYLFPRSIFSEIADYPRVVRAVIGLIDFWEGEIDRHKPKLLLNCGKTGAVIARARGLPFRTLIGARYKNRRYWAHNEYGDLTTFADTFRQANEKEAPTLQEPYTTHLEMRRNFLNSQNLWGAARDMAQLFAQRLYWRVRRYDKARGYFLREELRYVWRSYRAARHLAAVHRTTLDDLNGQRFVYYPLHTEPEIALQGFSPECLCQLSCIASLARDLPAGTVLAVKETLAALGRRPRDFYGQISEFKNVVLLRPDQFGLKVAEAADATATITGTGGFEAAVAGRPVISFGRHNLYNILPHVFEVFREEELRVALKKALASDFDGAAAARDGKRFLNAVIASSFDLEDFAILHADVVSDAAVSAAFCSLQASLPGEN